jgi:hypothetical protein
LSSTTPSTVPAAERKRKIASSSIENPDVFVELPSSDHCAA